MPKKLLFIFLPLLFFAFLKSVTPAQAEIVVFRIARDDPQKGSCYPMSLTENISTRINGQTGAGCAFTLDVTASGEWVTAGDYFNTPPYAWGSDSYYNAGGNADYSFTCNQPTYTLNRTTLPSYITLTREENISGTGTTIPAGKRYHFAVSSTAPSNSSFNTDLSFISTCTMKKQGGEFQGVMTPVARTSNACGQLPVITINPRKGSLKLPITIGTSCAPTKTPTPRPSNTPVPSRTPTKTPTPTPPPSCGEVCVPSDNQCPQQCPLCIPSGGTNRCVAPTRTPTRTPTKTPTPLPQCNGPCVPSDNQCPEQCPFCVPSGGVSRCVAPTKTPTPTPPPSCGEVCVPSDNQCPQQCPLCIPSGGTNRCAAPTRTPTPTPLPLCNGPCVVADNLCPQECPVCKPTTGGQGVCAAPTATPTPPPVCNGPCVVADNKCPIECPICKPTSGGQGTCAAPTATPTPLPVCNGPCVVGDNKCPQECPLCVPNGTGNGGVCAAPSATPTITPTPPPVCAGPCVPNLDTCPIDCPACAPSATGGGTVCRIPASCNCDGFEYSGTIDKGKTVTFTAFAKVEDPDSNDAVVLNMIYHVEANGVEIANSGRISAEGPERTTDSQGKPIDRYKTSWNYTIPANGTGEVVYRAFVKINCTYKSQTKVGTQSVAPAPTVEQPNLLQRIVNFVLSIFTGQSAPTVRPLQTGSAQIDWSFEATDPVYWTIRPTPTIEIIKTVKLGTFSFSPTPTPTVELACKQVIFKISY